MTDTQTEEVVEEETTESTGKYVHIVSPPENLEIFGRLFMEMEDPGAKDIVAYALKYGLEVTAVCGYKWIPTSQGETLDACPICMDVAGMHIRNAHGG